MSDAGQRITALWSDEGCDWKCVFEASHFGAAEGFWNVYLEWTSESGNPHHADFVTYCWQFYDTTIDGALGEALAWLEALVPWEKCGECDGLGAWQGVACEACAGTGLASGCDSGGTN